MTPRDRFEELLADYAEGSIAAADRAEFDGLCREHPAWAAEAEAERRIVESLRAMPHAKAPAGLLEGALAKARTADVVDIAPAAGGSRGAWKLAIAASFAGMMAIGYFMKDGFEPPAKHAVAAKQAPAPEAEGFAKLAEPARRNEDAPPAEESAAAAGGTFAAAAMVPPPAAAAPAAKPAESMMLADAAVAAEADDAVPLPTREEVAPILLANAGRIIADTPFASTANAMLNGIDAPEADEAPAPDARFLVVELPKPEDAEKAELAYAQNAARDAKKSQALRNSQRLMFAYQNVPPQPMPGGGAADSFGARTQPMAAPRQDIAARAAGPISESKEKRDANATQANAFAAPQPAREYATLAGAAPGTIASAEQLVILMRDRGGALLSQANARSEALGQSRLGKDGRERQKNAGPRFLVFIFQDATAALDALDAVRALTAEPGAGVDLAAAELVERDGRLRLIVPAK